jgi:Fe-S cluster biosynthesis and repair protein YggX
MAQIPCTRCKQTGEQLPAPPLPSELGNQIYDTICQNCWQEWLQTQTAIINHYGLDLREQDARKFLTQQTEAFLFGQPQG